MTSMTIRMRLMLSVGLTVFLCVSFNGIINYNQASGGLEDKVSEILSRTGDNTTRFVNNWFEVKSQMVSAAGQALSQGGEIDAVIRQGQLSGNFEVMYVGSGAGQMLTFPPINLPSDYDPRTRPWYTQARQAGTQIVTPPYNDASEDKMVMTFAEPVGADVVAADVELGDVIREVLGVRIGTSGYAAVLDGDGKFLIHPDKDKVGKSIGSMRGASRLGSTPSLVEIEDEQWLAAAFPIQGVDWELLLLMKESDALEGVGALAWTNLLISVFTILAVILMSGYMISRLMQPLLQLNQAMSAICQGDADLTKRLDIKTKDEIGKVSGAFNHFVSLIHSLVSDTKDSASQLTSLSNRSRDNAQQNNDAIKLQQSEISQVAAAINEMSTTSSHVADNASDTAAAAQQAAEEGNKGMQNASENKRRMAKLTKQIDDTTETITRLAEQAQQINSILATIQGIAEQTNLLALNAAIEAARAGEQGRGFAVVADEVRALSARTHEATGEIQAVIGELQEQTQNAVTIMEESKQTTSETGASAQEVTNSLMNIAEAIEDISTRASTIAQASREQYTSTEELNRIANAIHDASNQLGDNVDQAKQQSDDLYSLSEEIDGNLSRFKV